LTPTENSDVQQLQQSGSDQNSVVDEDQNENTDNSVRFVDIDVSIQNVEDQGNEKHQAEADDLEEIGLHIPPIQIPKPSTEQRKSGNREKEVQPEAKTRSTSKPKSTL